jgi:hypothetical protein
MKTNGRKPIFGRVVILFLALFLALPPGSALYAQNDDSEIAGCATSTEADYSGGFDENDFEFTNIGTTDGGNLELLTGQQAINPDKIVVPFEQELFANFIYEGGSYKSDFGWMQYKDAVNENGDFLGWRNIPNDKKFPIFVRMAYETKNGGFILNNQSQRGGSDRAGDSEANVENWDDGTGNPFLVNNDGQVDNQDMRKSLAQGRKIAGGTEIVFWLAANSDWRTAGEDKMRYSKTVWNPDYNNKTPPADSEYWIEGSTPPSFRKVYQLGVAGGETWKIKAGWMTNAAINTLKDFFGVQLATDDEYTLTIAKGEPLQYLIVGAPANDPDQWVLGWEDLSGGGDTDHNDLVFRIERKTGGTASLKSENAIIPDDDTAYYTGVTIDVWDYIPGSGGCEGKTDIRYYVSIDNGENWHQVREWNSVEATNRSGDSLGQGNIVDQWIPGTPESTRRTATIDYAAKGMSGRELLWKAEMLSENENCVPEILNVELVGTVANNAIFSRSSPTAQTNVVYSGNYETPAADWPVDERRLRGHLIATRIYDPENRDETNSMKLWDAGEELAARTPSDRKILFNKMDFETVQGETIFTTKKDEMVYSGTLNNTIVQGGSLSFSVLLPGGKMEKFSELYTNVLVGERGSSGTLNRSTGEFEVEFKVEPLENRDVKASYNYYETGSLLDFVPANLDVETLNLSDEDVVGLGIRDDFSGDGEIDADDVRWLARWTMGYKDGNNTKKAWPLGPIDHSSPAIMVPPGWPSWYPAIEKTALGASYRAFREEHEERRTAIFVGSRSGMMHAFDGGAFRWGDNPDTSDFEENRGYFEWENSTNDNSVHQYGDGSELWAYIPSNMLSRLKNNVHGYGDPAYVDASPSIADVHVNGAWRTVLLAAQGNGGDSVFALDVTNPETPEFMWEFIDPDLFRSSSSPAIGQVGRIAVGGEERWAAFFVSGKTGCNDPDSEFCYPSIFIIDIADGSVIEREYLDAVDAGVGGVPSGQPAIMDFDGNGFIDRLYVGTDKGRMYKVNLPDDGSGGITNCVINTDFTAADGSSVTSTAEYQDIYASPTVIKDGGVVKIFFGTADSPHVRGDQSSDEYHFFGYVDSDAKGQCGGAELDWFLELEPGHRVFASAFASAGRIYFGTSTADTEDPCEGYGLEGEGANDGRLYALDFDGPPVDGDPTFVETGDLRAGPVVYDEHVYYQQPASSPDDPLGGVRSLGDASYDNEPISTGNPDTSRSWWREVY